MTYLIDTNIVSEMSRPKPDTRVVAWLAAREPEDRFISVITAGELETGILRLPPGKRRNALRKWLEQTVLADFHGAILPVSLDVARAWSELAATAIRIGRPLQTSDGLIAATALVHGLILATRNAKDFEGRGIKVSDPWR